MLATYINCFRGIIKILDDWSKLAGISRWKDKLAENQLVTIIFNNRGRIDIKESINHN